MLEGTGIKIDTITTDMANTIKAIAMTGMTDANIAPASISYAANAAPSSTERGRRQKTAAPAMLNHSL